MSEPTHPNAAELPHALDRILRQVLTEGAAGLIQALLGLPVVQAEPLESQFKQVEGAARRLGAQADARRKGAALDPPPRGPVAR